MHSVESGDFATQDNDNMEQKRRLNINEKSVICE